MKTKQETIKALSPRRPRSAGVSAMISRCPVHRASLRDVLAFVAGSPNHKLVENKPTRLSMQKFLFTALVLSAGILQAGCQSVDQNCTGQVMGSSTIEVLPAALGSWAYGLAANGMHFDDAQLTCEAECIDSDTIHMKWTAKDIGPQIAIELCRSPDGRWAATSELRWSTGDRYYNGVNSFVVSNVKGLVVFDPDSVGKDPRMQFMFVGKTRGRSMVICGGSGKRE